MDDEPGLDLIVAIVLVMVLVYAGAVIAVAREAGVMPDVGAAVAQGMSAAGM